MYDYAYNLQLEGRACTLPEDYVGNAVVTKRAAAHRFRSNAIWRKSTHFTRPKNSTAFFHLVGKIERTRLNFTRKNENWKSEGIRPYRRCNSSDDAVASRMSAHRSTSLLGDLISHRCISRDLLIRMCGLRSIALLRFLRIAAD